MASPSPHGPLTLGVRSPRRRAPLDFVRAGTASGQGASCPAWSVANGRRSVGAARFLNWQLAIENWKGSVVSSRVAQIQSPIPNPTSLLLTQGRAEEPSALPSPIRRTHSSGVPWQSRRRVWLLLFLVFLYLGSSLSSVAHPVMWLTVAPDGQISTHSPPPAESPKLIAGIPIPSATWAEATLPNLSEGSLPPDLPEAWRADRWRVEDGLPLNFVRTVHQTRDGYLWVGTASGLARFDGRRFVVFDEHNTPELRTTSADIRRLTSDQNGHLLVGAADGVLRLQGGSWDLLATTATNGKNRLRDLTTDSSNRVWVATDQGLRWIHQGQLSTEGIPPELAATPTRIIGAAASGHFWLGGNFGLGVWLVGTEEFRTFPRGSGGMETGADGTVWIREVDGVLKTAGGEFQIVPASPVPADIPPSFGGISDGLSIGPGGAVSASVGKRQRLYRLRENRFEPVVTTEGEFIDGVVSLCEDSEGNLWCGTEQRGLLRLRPQALRPLSIEEPLRFGRVSCVAEGIHGSIWCGTPSGLIEWSQQRTRIFPFSPPDGVGGFSVTSVPAGIVWAGFNGGGVISLGPATNTLGGGSIPIGTVHVPPALDSVRALCRMRNTLFLIGNRTGVRIPGYLQIDTRHGLGHSDIRALLEDRYGDLWVGTYGGGISRIKNLSPNHTNFTVTTFTTDQGLSHNEAWSLHEDPDGALWIGTKQGLNRFKDGRFFTFTTQHGLYDDLVNHLLEDDFGRFWISCNRGIYRIRRADLNAVADGHASRVHCAVFGEADGMLSAETSGESQPAGCKASDGRLYFPTVRGLVVIDPRDFVTDPPAPSLVIEQVLADGDPVAGEGVPLNPAPGSDPAAKSPAAAPKTRSSPNATERNSVGVPSVLWLLPGTAHTLAIRYTAGSLGVPERVLFEHRLIGLDDRWQRGTSDRVAHYNHLQPGHYRFEVRAISPQGILSPTSALDLTLDPHFWQTKAFYVLIGSLVIGFALLIQAWRLRFQRRLLLLQQQHALELERARIARDMHDRLGANLSRIALTSSASGVSQSQVRDTLRELKDLIWSVNPKNDFLSGLADFLADAAQQYLDAAGLPLDLDWPDSFPVLEVPGVTRQHLASAFKEALRNIVQHAQATEVQVQLKISNDHLHLVITDNGRGFDPASLTQSGNGLRNLQERLREVGGSCTIESRPGSGTRVRFDIPLPSPRRA